MTVPSYVAEAAIEAVRLAGAEIGTPAARAAAAEAEALVLDPPALAATLDTAVAQADDERLPALAAEGVALPAAPETTANRRIQAANGAALVDLVRGLAAVTLAERTGARAWQDRTGARAAQEATGDALDALAATADTATFRALRSLRAAVAAQIDEAVRDLPDVIAASPGAVRPSLALAYDFYDDIGRAGEIVARNRLARPGFVPNRPIERLAS